MERETTCRRGTLDEILPLRHRILRAELPFETATFEGDDDPATRHSVACHKGAVVCCLTLVPSAWEGQAAWQLRGMATDAAVQGRGLGRRLLEDAVADARRDEPGRIFWCNARISAIGFYERLGWRVVSEPFDVPTAGPHVKMIFGANPAPRRPVAGFIAAEIVFLVGAHLLGGPPWVAIGVLACVMQVVGDFRLRPLLGIAPALAWAAMHHVTGNRELFFPYSMYLAAHIASQFAGRGWIGSATAGATVVVAFLGIRAVQDATARVLAVEFAVALAILAAVVFSLMATEKRPGAAVVVAALASLAAYAGLAL